MHDLSLIQKILIGAIPMIYAITLHEVAHGWVAYKLGDSTAKQLGRLTLNPIKHIDLIGSIIVPTLLFLTTHIVFGWAKPVPVNYQRLHNPRRSMAIVAFAGPLSNFVMAIGWACFIKAVLVMSLSIENNLTTPTRLTEVLIYIGYLGINMNLTLMLLNLIPIPPLDGSRILASLLPPRAAYYYNRVGYIGFAILLILLASGILSLILEPSFVTLFKFLFETFDLYSIQRIMLD